MVELLVVIAVLGVLAAGMVVLINPAGQIQKSRDAQRKSDLEQIQRLVEQYYNDNGKYPATSGYFPIIAPCTKINRIIPSTGSDCLDWGTTWTEYSTILPKDPGYKAGFVSRNYGYWASTDGQQYAIYASLEVASDLQVCSSIPCPNANVRVSTVGCGSPTAFKCNYGVTSPNITP